MSCDENQHECVESFDNNFSKIWHKTKVFVADNNYEYSSIIINEYDDHDFNSFVNFSNILVEY